MALKKFDQDAVVKIFRKIVQNFATEDALKKVDQRVDDIISEGGEPNVIDTVKQNGVALPVTDKAVDVTVPTKTSELENDSGYITDAQTVEFGDDVMYVGSGDDKFWYLENEETFVYSDDSGLEYDEGSETITYPASDDFSYADETISYTGGESRHLCDVIDKSTGNVYEIYDAIARENIESLEGSVETIAGTVADLQEQTENLKTELSENVGLRYDADTETIYMDI